MPLQCLDAEGSSTLSVDLSGEALRLENHQNRSLRFPCRSTGVILKRSSRGLRYFAHKPGGDCTSGPESEAHHYLKALALEAARAAGWTVRVEVSGRARPLAAAAPSSARSISTGL